MSKGYFIELGTCHRFNPPMGGAGGSQQVFPVFLRMGRAFLPNKLFSCNLILGTSVHEKTCQIGPTTLALKLDEGGGCLVSSRR